MVRLLYIADYTERYPHELIKGILDYSKDNERFIIYKMPISYYRSVGTGEVIELAIKKKIDVVVGQINNKEDISGFIHGGAVVFTPVLRHKMTGVVNIVTDNRQTGRLAADHFVEQGFKNTAFLGYKGVYWSEDRCSGFCERLKELGQNAPVSIYSKYKKVNTLDYDPAPILKWLQSLPKPVAIWCCDDNAALVLQDVCEIGGISCPAEVAIAGVDNDEIICAMSEPPISSIQVDVRRGGWLLAQRVLEIINGDKNWEEIKLTPLYMVPRESTSLIVSDDKPVLLAIRFIRSNADKKIKVDDVLKEVPLSRRLFEVRFKKTTGQTVYQYILEHRMDYFKKQLLESDQSVANIAAMMEESDTKIISRAFKKLYGMSPSEFRKNSGRRN